MIFSLQTQSNNSSKFLSPALILFHYQRKAFLKHKDSAPKPIPRPQKHSKPSTVIRWLPNPIKTQVHNPFPNCKP